MHDNHASIGLTSYPTVPLGSFRIWDLDGTLWSNLEPSRGSYNWSTLDNWISTLNSHGVTDIIYTFGYSPSWCAPSQSLPCTNNQDFVDFITALTTRYKGKIRHYEAWNEVTSSTFWTGSMSQLVTIQNDVYNTVKSIDPSATVHTPVTGVAANSDCNNSGAGTFSLNNFLAANGTSNFDAVDLHLYPYPAGAAPENLGVMVANARCAMSNFGINKPIWNTEFSWGMNSDLPNISAQVAWLGRSYLFLWSKGIPRSYWYAYDNSQWGTLWNGGLTAVGVAYQQIYNWMVGSTMSTPCAASGTVYTCGLTESNGTNALAVWNTAGSSSFTVAPGSYSKYRDLAGGSTSIAAGATSVSVGTQPILLEGSAVGPAAPSGLTATVN
jgi:hypothetical protein